MSVAYHSLTKIIADAKDLGVTDKPLAPLREFTDRNAQLTKLMGTIETKRNHVAEAFANGTDLAAALKAEADDQAIYARATAHSTALTDLVGGAMLDLVDEPKNIDPLLAALSKILQPAESALNKIAERWGDNPDAEQVAAEATATELKAYRARGEHLRTRKRVYAILQRLFATTAGYGQGTFPMVIVPTGGLPDQVLHHWLITDDGAIRSQQHARAKVNAFRSLEELSRHDEVLTNPKRPFIAKYAVHPDRLADATFNRDGTPTNPDDLMTPDEYYLLFGTTANDDQAAQSRNNGAVDEYMAELNNRKNN